MPLWTVPYSSIEPFMPWYLLHPRSISSMWLFQNISHLVELCSHLCPCSGDSVCKWAASGGSETLFSLTRDVTWSSLLYKELRGNFAVCFQQCFSYFFFFLCGSSKFPGCYCYFWGSVRIHVAYLVLFLICCFIMISLQWYLLSESQYSEVGKSCNCLGSGCIQLKSWFIRFTCNICFSNGLQSVIQLSNNLSVFLRSSSVWLLSGSWC